MQSQAKQADAEEEDWGAARAWGVLLWVVSMLMSEGGECIAWAWMAGCECECVCAMRGDGLQRQWW